MTWTCRNCEKPFEGKQWRVNRYGSGEKFAAVSKVVRKDALCRVCAVITATALNRSIQREIH